MTAPLIWIGLPAVMGFLLVGVRNRYPWSPAVGLATAAGLALLGLFLPLDEVLPVGPFRLLIASGQIVLGRAFVIGPSLLRIIGASYGALTLWGLVALVLKSNRVFIPGSLLATALLCAGLAVQLWQFAGIFILLAVLVLVPVLSPAGSTRGGGVLKFVAFQAIGVPFLIAAGTLMEGFESIPPGLALTLRPGIFLGLSFVFLLAIFPFHGWIPALITDEDPFLSSFILVLLPGFIGVLGLQLIDRYLFLRGSAEFFALARAVGMLSVVAGSSLVLVQRQAGRVLGYAASIETGMLLLAIGAGPGGGPRLLFPILAVRSASFLLWSAGLAALSKEGNSLHFSDLRGTLRSHPVSSAAVLVGVFSTAGFPLFAGFPVKLNLAAILAPLEPTAVFATWLGMAGMAIAGALTLAAMAAPAAGVAGPDDPPDPPPIADPVPRKRLLPILLATGCLLLLFFGLFPGWIEWLSATMSPAFANLMR
ncbi:MAG TPA: proton-conducting transporter membrane subunit [Anaerolineales bacterium]|nr:proton-conducting transporter membrane subunit [Anaerolineales bacterium]